MERRTTPGFGKILRVDLDGGRISMEAIPDEVRARFVGGLAVNDWLFWQHFLKRDPRIDPLSPENVLILGVGVLTGIGFPIGTKMTWTFKSPATGIFGDSHTGGRFGSCLRWAGYDHVVITGRAKKPVYLWIADDKVEIRDASDLRGRIPGDADRRIKEVHGDHRIETALIGPAAEKGARICGIAVSRHRFAGRCGGGAVMASKNLKGIAVRGTRGVDVYNPKALFDVFDEVTRMLKRNPDTKRLQALGTSRVFEAYNVIGVNQYRNCQRNVVPSGPYELMLGDVYRNKLGRNPTGCGGCAISCSSFYEIKGDETPGAGRYKGEIGTRAEYLPMASFGAMCDIPDWAAMNHLTKRCNDYAIDPIEVGCCLALIMELWQRGEFDHKDMDAWMGERLSFDWGNIEAAEKFIDAVGRQDTPLGQMAGMGVYLLAKKIEQIKNVPALKYAMYGKGGAGHVEDIRNTPGWAVNYAVSQRGCDHLKGIGTLDKVLDRELSMKYFGTPDAVGLNTTLKGASSAKAENFNGMLNLLGVCLFLGYRDPLTYSPEFFSRVLLALTGIQFRPEELLLAGERAVNIEKAFNSRIGLRREDDILCHRWMKESQTDGMKWKAEDYLEELKSEQYEWHGWDKETSLQTRRKLEDLGLKEVADVLAKEGALAPA